MVQKSLKTPLRNIKMAPKLSSFSPDKRAKGLASFFFFFYQYDENLFLNAIPLLLTKAELWSFKYLDFHGPYSKSIIIWNFLEPLLFFLMNMRRTFILTSFDNCNLIFETPCFLKVCPNCVDSLPESHILRYLLK